MNRDTHTVIPAEAGIQRGKVGPTLQAVRPLYALILMDSATALVYNTKTPTSADRLRLRTLAEVAELVDAQR